MCKHVYLMGGLGNCLFQLNYAFTLAKSNKKVVINTSLLSGFGDLMGWSNHGTLRELKEIGVLDYFEVEDTKSLSNYALCKISKLTSRRIFSVEYLGLTVRDTKANHIFGYHHLGIDIASDFVDLLKSLLQKLLIEKNIRGKYRPEAVIIHLRGGDYRGDADFMIEYDYIGKLFDPNQEYDVITNDRVFAQNTLDGLCVPFKFASGESALEDFMILMDSKSKILTNSTFSWWAAELNSKSSVYQPSPFYSHVKWDPKSNINRIGVQL